MKARLAVCSAVRLAACIAALCTACAPSANDAPPACDAACREALQHKPSRALWTDDQLTVRGYADHDSVNRGESVGLHVSTTQSSYDLEVYRIGHYGGAGRKLITAVRGLPGANQPVPSPDPVNGTVACNWPLSYTLQTGANWASGVYLIVALAGGSHGNIVLIVRDDGVPHDLLMEIPTATYQAYNNWGGKSLYDYNSTDGRHAYKVSFDRPYYEGNGAGQLFLGNYNMIRFLEANGYDVTYATSTDLHARPQIFAGRKALVSDHHSEYWSAAMRDNVTAARDQGMSLAFFDSNDMFWQIRYEGERIEVCYKDAALDPLASSQPQLTTVTWRKAPVNRPENALFGVMFEWFADYNVMAPWTVVNSSHWIYRGTGLRDGDQIPNLVGDEWDRIYDNGFTPAGLTILSDSHFPYTDADGLSKTATQNAVVYTAPSGALVFSAATIGWSLRIDDNEAQALGVDFRVQQMTRNVLDRMIANPVGGGADAGTPDAGTPDAGTPDAGTPDAGTPDAGTPDAGTPDAGTPLPGATLFLDNFNRTNTSSLASTWRVVAGNWREDGREAQTDTDGTCRAAVQSLSCADCAVQARVIGFGVGVVALDVRQQASGDRYAVALLSSGNLQIRRLNGSTTTVLADAASGIADLSNWATISLSVSGASPVQLSASVNGVVKARATDGSSSALTRAGTAGIAGEFAGQWFDDFTVTALGSGSPGDGGTPDAGTPDAGTPDAGTPDAGTPDAGTPDAGTPDAGTPDAGTPDAGTPDAGTPDAGVPGGVIFSDNFNRTLSSGLGANWIIVSGRWLDDSRANSDSDELDRATVAGVSCRDCRIDARVVGFGGGEAMLELRSAGSTRYALVLAPDGTLVLRRYLGGTVTTLKTAASGIADLTDWSAMSFSISGTAPVVLNGYVNNVLRLSATDSGSQAITAAGSAGIAATISGIWIDDFTLSR